MLMYFYTKDLLQNYQAPWSHNSEKNQSFQKSILYIKLKLPSSKYLEHFIE